VDVVAAGVFRIDPDDLVRLDLTVLASAATRGVPGADASARASKNVFG